MTTFENLRQYATQDREPFFKITAKYHRPGMRVLEVGAGDGAFADLLGDPSIALIEGNAASAAKLRQRYANVVEMRLPGRVPAANGAFDLIHCSHVIEHLQFQDLIELLGEFDRCLAPGGCLVISTPLLWDHFYDDLSHIKPYTPRTLEAYLCGARQGARTSAAVSDRYAVVELQYRYAVVPMPYFTVGYSRPILQRILYAVSSVLRRINFGYYQPNGYTIVLRKS